MSQVSFAYDTQKVIDNLSLSVDAGEFIVLSGESGSGKSTILGMMNGVIPYLKKGSFAGEVCLWLDGAWQDIRDWTTWERARYIGSVLQNADEQIIYQVCEDEVAFPLENLRVSRDEMHRIVPQVLSEVGLNANARTETLSGGEKQQLITASTLGMAQSLLLFDEPLANLDEFASIRLLAHLRNLCDQKGYAVVLCEHRLDLLANYADKLLWLEKGQLKERAWPESKENGDWLMSLEEKTLERSVVFSATDVAWAPAKIQGMDFTIFEGEQVLIVGDNGSGKTSLIHLLVGFEKPTSGTIYSKYTGRKRFKKIGYVLQNPNYQLLMSTVWDEISYQAVSEAHAEFLLKHFELENLKDRHPHSLSEGQKRKVGFASILAMAPDVLILDEPTVGQDAYSLGLMLESIAFLRAEKNVTVLMITHDRRLLADTRFPSFTQKITLSSATRHHDNKII